MGDMDKIEKKEYDRARYERNKERIKEERRIHYEENKEKIKGQHRAYNLRNKGKCRELTARYRRENPEKCRRDARNYGSNRRKVDPEYQLTCNLRCRLYQALARQGATKANGTIALTGCSAVELKSHLEGQFTDGMTWDNYGDWHMDHIKPCASFDLMIDSEQRECFHYTNLQPLWAEDNLIKGKKQYD
jgi:hypothetical protein